MDDTGLEHAALATTDLSSISLSAFEAAAGLYTDHAFFAGFLNALPLIMKTCAPVLKKMASWQMGSLARLHMTCKALDAGDERILKLFMAFDHSYEEVEVTEEEEEEEEEEEKEKPVIAKRKAAEMLELESEAEEVPVTLPLRNKRDDKKTAKAAAAASKKTK